MLPSGGIYAVKKRKKPVQKSPKPPPSEGAKSNPSKRHRDRLNQELNKLTNLLPFPDDVRARLDKLSILRLIVGYLKVKGFFSATMKKTNAGWLGDPAGTFGANGHKSLQINGQNISEAELLLQALDGFIIAVTADGYVFYVSPTIQDYLGFHQSDVIYQSVFELIHTDDRSMFRCQLHWALNPPPYSHNKSEQGDEVALANQNLQNNATTYTPEQLPPENSSFLERNFVCRFRCLLDNSSGFLALTFQGRLKFLHGQNKRAEDGSVEPPQLAFFAVASPLQPPSILELRTKTFIFQTKHKLDFTPLACDSRGKVVLGYSEMELCMRGTGYQFIHAADMMYCADNHVRMIKTGESGMTVFRLLTKQAGWIWVQANARLVYKAGRPDCIIARQRALSNEEGEEHLRKRALQLPFTFATGEAVLYQNNLPQFPDPAQPKTKPSKGRKISEVEQKLVDPSSILGAMMKQDEAVYVSHPGTEPRFALPSTVDEGWQIDQNSVSVKQEGDPLLAILETLLEKGEAGDGTLEGLDANDLDLEGWEESLLQMERDMDGLVGHVSHLTSEVSTFLEDVLFKQENTKNNTFLDGVSPTPVCLQSSALRHTHKNSSNSAEFSSGLGSQEEPPGSKGLHSPLTHFPQNSHVGLDQDAKGNSNKQSVSDQRSIFTPVGCGRQCPVAGNFSDSGQVFQRTEGTYVTDFPGQSIELSRENPTEKNDTLGAPQHQRTPSTSTQMCMWPAAMTLVPQDSTFQSPQNLMGGAQNRMGSDVRNIWQPLTSEQPGLDPASTGQCAPGILTASGQWKAPGQCDSYREQGLPGGSRTGYPQETDLQALLCGSVQYSRGRGQSTFAGASVDFSRGRGMPCQSIGAMEYLQNSVNAVNSLQGQACHTQTSLAVGHAYQQQQILSQNQPFSSSLSRTSLQTLTSCRPTPSQQNRLLVLGSQDVDVGYHSASGVGDPALDNNPHAPIELQGPANYMYPPCGYNKVVLPPHIGSLPQHQTLEACCDVTTPDETFFFQNIAEEPQLGLSAPSQMESGFSKPFCQYELSCPPVSLTDGQQLFSYNIQLEQFHQPDDNAPLGFTPSGPTQSHIFS